MPDDKTITDLYNELVSIESTIGTSNIKLDYIYNELVSIYNVLNRSYSVPAASTLISEYYGNEDLDSNGLVFGYDFYITDPPLMLTEVPTASGMSSMTWSSYLNSV
jgi:hypothetical protein